MTDAVYSVTYLSTLLNGEKHPRRVEHLGEAAASALARELSRRESIESVVVERWEMVSKSEVQ